MKTEDINWSKVVSYILNNLHYTQAELGELCGGQSQQCVSQWKQGATTPSPDKQNVLIEMLEEKGLKIDLFSTKADERVLELIELYKMMSAEEQTELMEYARAKELECWCPVI